MALTAEPLGADVLRPSHRPKHGRPMNRDELTALRDVLNLILRLPDDLRAQVAAWLSPAAAKPGNGLDPHPPPVAPVGQAALEILDRDFR